MRGAAVIFKGAASGVLVLLTATVVCGQSGWSVTYSPSQICALEGSTVKLSCSYSYPRSVGRVKTRVINYFWFTKEANIEPVDLTADSKYSGRVHYGMHENRGHLIIANVRKSDSDVFKFRFITNHETGKLTGYPGVTLSVTDPKLQINVRRIQASNWTELTCHSDCQLPDVSYIWYQNGRIVQGETKKFIQISISPSGRYSCAINGYKRFPSPDVYAPDVPSVSVNPSTEVMEGGSVSLTCSSDANPAAKYTWNKKDDESPLSSGQNLIISNIKPEHGGLYFCKVQNSIGHNNSTIQLTVAGNDHFTGPPMRIMNITKLSIMVLLLVLLLVFNLWMRKKKTVSLKTGSEEPEEMLELDLCVDYENINGPDGN